MSTLTNFVTDFTILTDFTTFTGRREDQTLRIVFFGPPLKHKEVPASFDKFCAPIFAIFFEEEEEDDEEKGGGGGGSGEYRQKLWRYSPREIQFAEIYFSYSIRFV